MHCSRLIELLESNADSSNTRYQVLTGAECHAISEGIRALNAISALCEKGPEYEG